MPRCLRYFTGKRFKYPTHCICEAMSEGVRDAQKRRARRNLIALKFDWLIKTDGTDLPIGYTDGIILSENDEKLWNPDKKISYFFCHFALQKYPIFL